MARSHSWCWSASESDDTGASAVTVIYAAGIGIRLRYTVTVTHHADLVFRVASVHRQKDSRPLAVYDPVGTNISD